MQRPCGGKMVKQTVSKVTSMAHVSCANRVRWAQEEGSGVFTKDAFLCV